MFLYKHESTHGRYYYLTETYKEYPNPEILLTLPRQTRIEYPIEDIINYRDIHGSNIQSKILLITETNTDRVSNRRHY